MQSLSDSGVVMPVVSAQVNFKSPAFFDDPLRVRLIIENIPRATIKIDYTIIDQSEKEIANGSTTLAFLNRETNRPIRCPQALLEIIEFL